MTHLRRHVFVAVAMLIVAAGVLAACGTPTPEPTPITDLEVASRVFVDFLSNGQYSDAVAMFSEQMASTINATELQSLWETLQQQVGAFQSTDSTRVAQEPPYTAVYVTCTFAQMAMDVKLVYDDAGKIAGMWFQPFQSPTPTS